MRDGRQRLDADDEDGKSPFCSGRQCCDPVTKACLSSCSIACAMVADVACRTDAPDRPMKSVIVRGPAQPRLTAHEPGWLDPPPKLVA